MRGPRTIAALCCGAAASLVRRLDPLLEGGHEAVPRLQRLLDLGVVDLVGREGQIILITLIDTSYLGVVDLVSRECAGVGALPAS